MDAPDYLTTQGDSGKHEKKWVSCEIFFLGEEFCRDSVVFHSDFFFQSLSKSLLLSAMCPALFGHFGAKWPKSET